MDPIGEPDTHSRGQTPAFDGDPNGGRSMTSLFDPGPFFSHVTEGTWISHGLDQHPHLIGDIPTRRPFLLRSLSLSHWPVTIVGIYLLIGGFAPNLCPFLPHAAKRTEKQPFPASGDFSFLALLHLTHLLRDNSDRLHPRFTGRPGGWIRVFHAVAGIIIGWHFPPRPGEEKEGELLDTFT